MKSEVKMKEDAWKIILIKSQSQILSLKDFISNFSYCILNILMKGYNGLCNVSQTHFLGLEINEIY